MKEYEWLTCEDNHLRMLQFLESNFEKLHTLVVCTCPPVELHSKFTVQRCHIIREIVGNPFRPILLQPKPSWLTTCLQSFAKGIVESERYDDVPVLADILEEAGCDNEELLRHFRQEVKCPECMGRGLIEPGNDYPFYPYKCDCCGGSGWLPKPIPCKSFCWGLRLIEGSKI